MSVREFSWQEIKCCLIRKCHVSREASSEVSGLGNVSQSHVASEFQGRSGLETGWHLLQRILD